MGNEARENARKRGLSPGRPTATEAEQIEERLLAAGWEVLATSNPDKLSLNQVARQAHASKKTLYARWSDKREFMLAMLENRLDALFDDLSKIDKGPKSEPRTHLARLAERGFSILSSEAGIELERLIDWLDATADNQDAWTARNAIFNRVLDWARILLSDRLTGLEECQQATLVHLWIDGIIGRSRTDPRPEPFALSSWAQAHSGFFLLAINSLGNHQRSD